MPLAVSKYLCLAGCVFNILLTSKNLWTHDPFPGELAFNTICQVICVCLLSISIFFGLYGYYVLPSARREHLAYCFFGSVVLAFMFFAGYMEYAVVNRMLDNVENQKRAPIISLPSLLDGTRRSESFQKRAMYARMAYLIYGVTLPIRQDDYTWNYYVPTPSDEEAFRSKSSLEVSTSKLRTLSHGLLAGAVNVVIYSFITFIFGLLWLAVKKPPRSPALISD